MPKKGERPKVAPRSFGQVIQTGIHDIAVPDVRFNRFYDYIPIPLLMQEDGFFRDKRRVKAVCGGNKCIDGSTKIFDPSIQGFRVVEETKSDFSVLAWNGQSLVVSKAHAPFVKGIDEMYEVSFATGTLLTCTMDHLILRTRTEYSPLRSMRCGDSVFLPESSSDIYQQARTSDGQSLLKTIQGSQGDCQTHHDFCDELPLSVKEIVQDDSPSPFDAEGSISFGCSFYRWLLTSVAGWIRDMLDAKARRLQHIRLLLSEYLRSIERILIRGVALSCVKTEYPSFSNGEAGYSLPCPQAVCESKPVYDLDRTIPVSVLSSDKDSASRPCLTPYLNGTNLHATIITSIKSVGKKKVWDFEVPLYHNYLAGGVINHNSGKTWAGIVEAVMIYTGIIPRALQGVYPHKIPSRPRHVRIICQDYSKSYAETIRPILIGEDYGMLPEAWSTWNEQEHMFTGPDGSYLSIVAVDPTEKTDPNTLRGPQIDHTMIDEISTEVAYSESISRSASLKSGPRTVTLTYCPQNGYQCWTYERLYAACYDKLTKRRLPKEKQHSDVFCQVVSMRDNPSITEETVRSMIATFREWEVPFRVFGEYSQRASNPYFKMEMLLQWEKENRVSEGVPVKLVEDKVDVEAGKFISHMDVAKEERDDGTLWRMWDEPKQNHRYVVAVDAAEGNRDSDFSVADVWDLTERGNVVQVAQLRTRSMKAGAFAVQAACMAQQFSALLVPETNNTAGGIVIDRVRNYVNLYRRMSVGRVQEEESERLGFHTGPMNKGTILEDLYKLLQRHFLDDKCPVKSRHSLMELIGYEEQIQRDKFGVSRCIWAARIGGHDDTVMSAAIAARIATHEYYKLNACIIEKRVVQAPSKLEEQVKKASTATGGAYGGMKKKPSLTSLRRKYADSCQDPNRRTSHGRQSNSGIH